MGEEGPRSDESTTDWQFLIDENLDPEIATELARRGIEAEPVVEALFEGADDFEDILPYCRETGAVLVTNNVRDFNAADISSEDHAGIVVVHDKTREAKAIAEALRRIVVAYPSQDALQGFENADDW